MTTATLNLDRLTALLEELDGLLEQVVAKREPSVRTAEVRAFLAAHRDEPGFKMVAVPALFEAEERLEKLGKATLHA